MTDRMPHGQTQLNHEAMYRRTIKGAMEGIEKGSFTPESVPRILTQLRAELAQCVELLLISPEFYGEQMEILQQGVAVAMES
jgi:hypothetical protein